MEDAEIKEFLDSFDGEWAVVKKFDEVVNIIENDVFKRFDALSWIIEDDALYSATNAYLLKNCNTRFENDKELNCYLAKLTKEKYGQE